MSPSRFGRGLEPLIPPEKGGALWTGGLFSYWCHDMYSRHRGRQLNYTWPKMKPCGTWVKEFAPLCFLPQYRQKNGTCTLDTFLIQFSSLLIFSSTSSKHSFFMLDVGKYPEAWRNVGSNLSAKVLDEMGLLVSNTFFPFGGGWKSSWGHGSRRNQLKSWRLWVFSTIVSRCFFWCPQTSGGLVFGLKQYELPPFWMPRSWVL